MRRVVSAAGVGVSRGIIELRQGLGLLFNYVFFPAVAMIVMYLLRGVSLSDGGPSLGLYAIPGVVSMNVLFTGLMGTASTLLTEREDGTLLRIRTLPHGTVAYVTAKIVSQTALTVVTLVVVMAAAVLLFDGFSVDIVGFLTLSWLVPLGIASMLPWGMALGTLLRHPRHLSFISLMLMGMTAMSGIFYPLALQSEPLRIVGQVFPLYWLGSGMRAVLLPAEAAAMEVGGAWSLPGAAAALSLWAVLAILLASFALRKVSYRGRTTRGRAASAPRRTMGGGVTSPASGRSRDADPPLS